MRGDNQYDAARMRAAANQLRAQGRTADAAKLDKQAAQLAAKRPAKKHGGHLGLTAGTVLLGLGAFGVGLAYVHKKAKGR